MGNSRSRSFDDAGARDNEFPIDHGECAICCKPIMHRYSLDIDNAPSVINHIDYAHRTCVERALRDGTAVTLPRAYERFRHDASLKQED